ncbi:hypothetical protein TrLO_g3043 [Triparma laevis f. longispina]|uniref:Uncharacterized protein n=1 Tax=Triparma laevis f. longispina TaxID=1714387 RepID=A0A9W7E7H5_9STRA|nr:hypothetical protein TrLO_g3043 [Triparma laevis f. longispina]
MENNVGGGVARKVLIGAGAGAVAGAGTVATIISGVGTAGSWAAGIQSANYGASTMSMYASVQSALATGAYSTLAGITLAGAVPFSLVGAFGGLVVIGLKRSHNNGEDNGDGDGGEDGDLLEEKMGEREEDV